MMQQDGNPDAHAQGNLPVYRVDRNLLYPGDKPEILSLYFLLFLFFKGFHIVFSPVWTGRTPECDCLSKTLAEH